MKVNASVVLYRVSGWRASPYTHAQPAAAQMIMGMGITINKFLDME